MEIKSKWVLAVIVLFCAIVLAASAIMIGRRARRVADNMDKAMVFAKSIDDAIHYRERSYREREGWAPEDFFQTTEAIRACEAISSGDRARLRELIDSGLDVNSSGKKGVTLLYWAFFDDNLEAFKQLLAFGADPDKKLTDYVHRKYEIPFRHGDSILFTCIEQPKWDYFFAALPHTRDVNQRNAADQTLLIACTWVRGIFGTGEDTLQRIIDAGVDLDAQDMNGNTAAFNAIVWERPQHCLQILMAGADPSIRNNNGQTVADVVAKRRGQEYDTFKAWLESHGINVVGAPTPEGDDSHPQGDNGQDLRER